MISANDLHDAADDARMLPFDLSAEEALRLIGLEPTAVRDFLAASNFQHPFPGGAPDRLDHWSVAYGICLGLVAAKREAEHGNR